MYDQWRIHLFFVGGVPIPNTFRSINLHSKIKELGPIGRVVRRRRLLTYPKHVLKKYLTKPVSSGLEY